MVYRHGKKSSILLAVLFGILLSEVSAKELVHVVSKGETVYSISRLYRVSQEGLMSRNGISDPSKLPEGMRLVIPSAAESSPTLLASIEYTVQPNETLYSIARSKGVMFQTLCDVNNFPKDYMVKAGEKIKIPKPAPQAVNSGALVIAPSLTAPERASNARPVPKDASVRWPVSAREIYYMNGNIGVLVSGEESESVKSLTSGTVVHASPWRGYGNVAIIETAGGYRYLYGVCQTLSVRKGDSIEPGTELGKLGIYPASGKPELVFIVSQNGSPIDPVKAPRL